MAHLDAHTMQFSPTLSWAVAVALAGAALLLSLPLSAQTLTKNQAWLQTQFNQLTAHEKDAPHFSIKGCEMKMTLDTKDKDASVGMNIAWQLANVRNVSYKKGKDGQYTLLLDVPADKVDMALSMGGFSGAFSTDEKSSKGKDNVTSLDLSTTDETLVKQIKQKVEESAGLCRSAKH